MFKAVEFKIKNQPLVFDDGGFIYSNPNNTGFKIDPKVYDRLLYLAKKNEIKIPVACTAAFFDVDNISKLNTVHPEAERILKIFDENRDFLEIWNHGLTHHYQSDFSEFYLYQKGSVSSETQYEKLKKSQEIFKKVNFFPKVFVPPSHAWEQGVTDKLAKEIGLETIAIREFEKKKISEWITKPKEPFKMIWSESENLKTLFRLGLGIRYDQVVFNKKQRVKTNGYIFNKYPYSLLINRKIKLKYPIDHFFAHIQNLQKEESVDFFNFVIKKIKTL